VSTFKKFGRRDKKFCHSGKTIIISLENKDTSPRLKGTSERFSYLVISAVGEANLRQLDRGPVFDPQSDMRTSIVIAVIVGKIITMVSFPLLSLFSSGSIRVILGDEIVY
jgi:hypothetical protein